MNSYDRVFNAMQGKKIDRLPNMNIVMLFAAKLLGVPYSRYVTDYKILTKGVLLCHEKFGIDPLCVISDPMREAEGMGAKVIVPEDGVPYSPENLIQDISDISKVKPVDPTSAARMNDRLEAIRFLKERAGKDAPVIGWVEGAVAESCDLMGVTEFMMNLFDYPEEIHHLLEICTEQAVWFAKDQIEAGADIIGIGDAASSLIGPDFYEEFALPYQQKLIKAIRDMGSYSKLHICGDLNPVLDLVAQTGADIIDLDHMVDMKKAIEAFPQEIAITGNFDPVSVLLQSDIDGIKKAVRDCIEIAGDRRYLVSAGCEVAKDTPPENLLAVHQVLL